MPNNYLLTREGKMVTIGDDELYHWKYIKRERVNGKWRYWYDNGTTSQKAASAKKQMDESAQKSTQAANMSKLLAKDAKGMEEAAEKLHSQRANDPNDLKPYYDKIKSTSKVMNDAPKDSAKYKKAYAEWKEAENKVATEWYQMKTRAAEDRIAAEKKSVEYAKKAEAEARKVIQAGQAYANAQKEHQLNHPVSKLLNNASDAIDKAKSWVSNLFKKKKKSK